MDFYFDKHGMYNTYSIRSLKDYTLPFSGKIKGEYFVPESNVTTGVIQIINDGFIFSDFISCGSVES